jgi:putative ABC transport system substrate-binding protein
MSICLRRREFVAALGGAVAWPLAVSAQQAGKLPTIGYEGTTTGFAAAFVQRLRELGWIEGRTVGDRIPLGRRTHRALPIAAEFVRLKVDVIATSTGAYAAKQETSVIPIVVLVSHDPIGTGLVPGLARPGGNVTGVSAQQADTAGERLELLRKAVPSLRRLAILVNAGDPGAVLDSREVIVAARTLGLEAVTSQIRRAEDIAPAFDALKGRADAMYVYDEALVNTNRINTLGLGRGCRRYTVSGVGRSGRPDVLRSKLSGLVPARRRIR